MKTLTQIFKDLAVIDSISGEEDQICKYVVEELKQMYLKPTVDKENNIYVRVGDKPNPVLFCAHIDTVEPGRGVKVIEKNGFLCSSGKTIIGGDNKASVALILFTLFKLINQKKDLNIEILFTVKEETDSGISRFNFKIIKSKIAFVFDGGERRFRLDGQICSYNTRLQNQNSRKIFACKST